MRIATSKSMEAAFDEPASDAESDIRALIDEFSAEREMKH
jgi:hypothetical protein